jgi:hypothetical protein
MRSTYTYAILEISSAAFAEIKQKLEAADYKHTFSEDENGLVIDMHGIALADEQRKNTKATRSS